MIHFQRYLTCTLYFIEALVCGCSGSPFQPGDGLDAVATTGGGSAFGAPLTSTTTNAETGGSIQSTGGGTSTGDEPSTSTGGMQSTGGGSSQATTGGSNPSITSTGGESTTATGGSAASTTGGSTTHTGGSSLGTTGGSTTTGGSLAIGGSIANATGGTLSTGGGSQLPLCEGWCGTPATFTLKNGPFVSPQLGGSMSCYQTYETVHGGIMTDPSTHRHFTVNGQAFDDKWTAPAARNGGWCVIVDSASADLSATFTVT